MEFGFERSLVWCAEAARVLSVPQVESVHGLARQRSRQESSEREEIARGEPVPSQPGECV